MTIKNIETFNIEEFEKKFVVRPLVLDDFDQIVETQILCFPTMSPWSKDQFESMLSIFPEGQICVESQERILASSSSLILDYDLYSDWHDWKTISDNGFIRNHDPEGDIL